MYAMCRLEKALFANAGLPLIFGSFEYAAHLVVDCASDHSHLGYI